MWTVFSQRKYKLDLLEETGLLEYKFVSTPMESDMDFWNEDSAV